MGSEKMQAAMRELQDAMLLLTDIKATRSEESPDPSEKFRLRTEENLAEIAE
jgi:hypothetical protein